MKTVGILALVLLLVLVGLPLAMGMLMDGDMQSHCPACTPDGPLALAMCLAILALFVLTIPLFRGLVLPTGVIAGAAGSSASLYRPPRTV
jgi:hypothetical protein